MPNRVYLYKMWNITCPIPPCMSRKLSRVLYPTFFYIYKYVHISSPLCKLLIALGSVLRIRARFSCRILRYL
ncbi:hypothetical protein BDZ94DRAFT_1251689 [Collybia nuda]|uniref:Uncharacterized protein n=1 Tax=Collybia nuda TaxID=64659 RepID=A0A9P5YEF4_9AGAR|nr:hypothetical protein BDZ94DRAFT_1251689 [Collybia nuda]